MSGPSLHFQVHPERLAIARLSPDAPLPPWARGGFVTVSRTPTELSIVCPERWVPAPAGGSDAPLHVERGRVALGIEGVVPMTTIGLLAALCGSLAAAGVSVFVISTYDTDWILVQAERLAPARGALEGLGHRVSGALPQE